MGNGLPRFWPSRGSRWNRDELFSSSPRSIFFSGLWGVSGGVGSFSETTIADRLSGGIFIGGRGKGKLSPSGFTEFDGGGGAGRRCFFGPFGGFFSEEWRRKLGG